MRTYQGSCHCKAVRFEIDADIDHVRVCDCFVCSMRGALIYRVPADAFRLQTSLDNLSVYRWGSQTTVDYFCPICGILPFRKPSAPTVEEAPNGMAPFDGWAVNTRCLEGFDPSGVPVRRVPGSALVIG
ncbi:GFA family protein [Burkholderia ubonensis]